MDDSLENEFDSVDQDEMPQHLSANSGDSFSEETLSVDNDPVDMTGDQDETESEHSYNLELGDDSQPRRKRSRSHDPVNDFDSLDDGDEAGSADEDIETPGTGLVTGEYFIRNVIHVFLK